MFDFFLSKSLPIDNATQEMNTTKRDIVFMSRRQNKMPES